MLEPYFGLVVAEIERIENVELGMFGVRAGRGVGAIDGRPT